MNNLEISQVLAQMRAISGELKPDQQVGEVAGTSFGDVLKEAVEKVNEQQDTASELITGFENGTGDVSLAEVMVSMQKASLSFQAMTEVRNKLIDAYHEVMNMPI